MAIVKISLNTKNIKTQIVKRRRNLKERFLFVGRNSGFHGLNRLFSPKANLFSRIFWLLIIVASIAGVYLMMGPVLELGQDISYTPDTLYLDWTTTFPAVTVCENPNRPATVKRFEPLFPELLGPLEYNFKTYLAEVVFASHTCSKPVFCKPCGVYIPCDVNWRHVIERVHKSCDEMIQECSYNDVTFPCCEYFKNVDSEHGPCFSFNTLQHKEPKPLFVMNRTTGPGALKFRLLSSATLSIHSSEELSTYHLDLKLKQTIRLEAANEVDWLFSVVEIENDPSLSSLSLDVRRCRYLHELPNEASYVYPVYSYGACRLARNTAEDLFYCHCIHPARDLAYQKFYCNYTGINCRAEDVKAKNKGAKKPALADCLPSCVESEISTVHFVQRYKKNDKPGALVNIKMVSLPTLRYKRDLMRTNLDLVVSVGGIAGLFFSASILSFLEIHYLIFRPQKFDIKGALVGTMNMFVDMIENRHSNSE